MPKNDYRLWVFSVVVLASVLGVLNGNWTWPDVGGVIGGVSSAYIIAGAVEQAVVTIARGKP